MFNEINNIENIAARRGLYRMWIRTHESHHAPLVSIWIDPAMTCFEPRDAKEACDSAGVSSVSATAYLTSRSQVAVLAKGLSEADQLVKRAKF